MKRDQTLFRVTGLALAVGCFIGCDPPPDASSTVPLAPEKGVYGVKVYGELFDDRSTGDLFVNDLQTPGVTTEAPRYGARW